MGYLFYKYKGAGAPLLLWIWNVRLMAVNHSLLHRKKTANVYGFQPARADCKLKSFSCRYIERDTAVKRRKVDTIF